MSFKLLKELIVQLRKKSKCPLCSSRFSEDSIFVIGTGVHPETTGLNALFMVVCSACGSNALVMAELIQSKDAKDHIRIETKSASGTVSINEVLDMHNFLKNWHGDVAQLL